MSILDISFEDVYEKYHPVVYRYLLGQCRNADVAEELAQETFFRALRSIDTYDESKKMLTWLCAIAKNANLTYLKKRSRTTAMPDEDFPDESEIIDRMIDSESGMELLRLLHELSEPYKEVFTLRTLGSLSFRQIGEVFSKTENWARVTYYRARLQLKERYENE